ncbi:hypothetical protein HYPSUDRAFT_149839 [Hypholoma sublateritium FD-334 SS-4]|uniref:Uncharacterized protein n=1 Tax=Hypholoma sublateritium (strain FD-334 SS-4) TaxID=945553 RepID=A0A0D2KJP4_HYPSF|nr:hypothetical protein HYPSUDRAFT_149839 [Hypholoma sublateritium FD-334 SS-4]
MSDDFFESIPRVLQRQIDAAFTQTYNDHFNPNDNPIPSTSGGGGFLPPSPPAGGGFLPPSPPAGGGFLPPSPPAGGGGFLDDDAPPAPTAEPTHLPLRLVPHALQRLDLPPDDSEVLGVLANAASGWQTPHVHAGAAPPSDSDEQWVARADWRAVCAVLLEGDDDDAEGPRSSSPGRSSLGAAADASDDPDADMDVDLSSLSDLSADDGASSDEFRLAPSPRTPKSKSRAKGKARASSSPPPTRRTRRGGPISGTSNSSTAPSERQGTTALAAFALFFPDLTPDAPALLTSRIRVAELQRAAGVLREKIKAEEMLEMLSLFSSAPDGSVGLDDFTRMMIAAQLA